MVVVLASAARATCGLLPCLLQVCRNAGLGMLVPALLILGLGGLGSVTEVVMLVMLVALLFQLALGRVCGMMGLYLRCSHMCSRLVVEPGNHRSWALHGTLVGHRYLARSGMALAGCIVLAGCTMLADRMMFATGCTRLVAHCIRSVGRASCMLYSGLVTVDRTAVVGMGSVAVGHILHLHRTLEIRSVQASLADIRLADRTAGRMGPGCCTAQIHPHKRCSVGNRSCLPAAKPGTCPDQEIAFVLVLLLRLRLSWIHLSRCRCDPACPTPHLPSFLAQAVPPLQSVRLAPLSRLAWREGHLR